MQKTTENGFTIVEIAIVIAIIGVLLAGASSLFISQINNQRYNETLIKLDALDEAFDIYVEINGAYPCPAPNNAAPDTANFGLEVNCGAAPGVGETVQVASLRGDPDAPANLNVRIGSMPTRTLNLPDDFAYDGWGRRFTYAVSETLADPGTFDRDEGVIDVVDSAFNPVVNPASSAHYVIVSHGESGNGALTRSGNGRLAGDCNALDLDGANCDDADATFIDTTLVSDVRGGPFFDDLVRRNVSNLTSIPLGAVIAFDTTLTGGLCPPGWAELGVHLGGVNLTGYTIVHTDDTANGINYNSTPTGFGTDEKDFSAIKTTFPNGVPDAEFASYEIDATDINATIVEVDTATFNATLPPPAPGIAGTQIFTSDTPINPATPSVLNGQTIQNLPPHVPFRYCVRT
ncbi:MAG: prepilin-type N-terminal cleavage/methylation domain-containing protein [Pseudomonadota bacterium]